jgi:Flp pilus assembly protein TadG
MERGRRVLALWRGCGVLGGEGAAAVELAIAAPVLILLVLGVADYGVLMGTASSLESATRAGAEVGKVDPSVTAATLTTLGLLPSGVTPVVTNVCTCVDNSTVTPCPPGPLATPCAGKKNSFGAVDPRVFEYVRISATQSFSPMVSYATLGFPSSLTAQAFTRTQ